VVDGAEDVRQRELVEGLLDLPDAQPRFLFSDAG
jgi:hypothetical protein